MIVEYEEMFFDDVVKILSDAFQKERGFAQNKENFFNIEDIIAGGGNVWLKIIDQKIVGVAAVKLVTRGTGQLLYLATAKDYRGKGIAKSLLRCATDWCRNRFLHTLYFTDDVLPEHVRNLLIGFGFRERFQPPEALIYDPLSCGKKFPLNWKSYIMKLEFRSDAGRV